MGNIFSSSSTVRLLKIQDMNDVREFGRLMQKEDGGGYDIIQFSYTCSESRFVLHPLVAEIELGDKGTNAVMEHIASSLETGIAKVHVKFDCCNLSFEAVDRLAIALERNTSLIGFTCIQNPFNLSTDDYSFIPGSDWRMERAVIATQAPLEIWDGYPLGDEINNARRERHGM